MSRIFISRIFSVPRLTKRNNELEMRRFDKTLINGCANCKHITNLGLQEWFWCHDWRPTFIVVTQCAVVNNINIAIALYRNWCRHVTILGDIVAPRYVAIYRDLFDTGIETSILTILIEVSQVSHSTSLQY